MNEMQFARRIRELLDENLDLGPETNARLKAIRERALARHRTFAPTSAVWSGRGVLAQLHGPEALFNQLLLPAAVIVVIAIAFGAWQRAGVQREQFLELQQRAKATAEIDAGLLTSELPLDAYLDQGFVAWLSDESQPD